MRTRCANECDGALEISRVKQRFERRGSRVIVIIHNIPVATCRVCDEVYLDKKTARQLDSLLTPFHGKHGRIPALPPARVNIEFDEAISAMKAA